MSRSRRPSFRLQRLVRGRFARLLAHAMAVLLVLANVSAWAAPASVAAERPSAHAQASDTAHHHCDEAAMKAHAGFGSTEHGKGCPCCVGGACACAYSCSGVLTAMLPELAPPHAAQPSASADSFVVDASGGRRLRPPIA